MTKFAEDLKRIIGIDRDQAATPEGKEIGGIPSVRGIGTQSGGSATSSSSVAGAGPEVEGNDTGSTSGKTDSTTSSDAGNSNAPNPSNPKSFIKSADSGKFSAKDIIDGTDGPSMKTADLATFQGVGFEGGALSGITAEDCASGDALDIRTDGLLVPPAATTYDDGTPKTAAWEDAETPPTIPGYEAGFYWETDTTSMTEAPTPFNLAAWNAGMADNNRGVPFIGSGGPGTVYGPNSFGDYYEFTSWDQASSTRYEVTLTQTDNTGTPIGPPSSGAWGMDRNTCPGDDGLASCPASAPTETAWPEDDTISLTYSGGRFVGSEYDPEITPTYLGQNSSAIAFCFDTNRHGIIRAAREGGTVIYETSGLNGAPTGLVRYYDSSGAFAGASDTTGLRMFLAPGDT